MRTTVYLSDYARLDSNVISGGGTDETEVIQAVFDKALEWGSLKVIVDGAALVRGLHIHSNTTVECLNKGCGFFLKDNSNCAIIRNSDFGYGSIKTFNITLIGGTYNHNCLNQEHHTLSDNPYEVMRNMPKRYTTTEKRHMTVAMEFIGIENLTVKDITVRDQRTFAFTVGNFRHVTIENTYIELENEIKFGNQDGFHFWGPGQFLTIRNVGGKTEDDFMNIGPDERDGKSSITDVLVDGVFLDSAWQGIRLLSRGKGLLDRVTIRNVTGTYGCFGFYINPWFIDKTMGNFGSITFENIDLRPQKNPLECIADENPPFLFSIGGDIENLAFKNISWYHSLDNRNIFQIGYPFHKFYHPFNRKPRIKNLLIDGLTIIEESGNINDTDYIITRGIIDRLTIYDLSIIRPQCDKGNGCLIKTNEDSEIGTLRIDRANIENIKKIVDNSDGKINKMIISNSICGGVEKQIAKSENALLLGEFQEI